MFSCQAVCALAGFYVGEQYHVPWAMTEVPPELKMEIFPFTEGALANLRLGSATNQGTINFLELLQFLRPYFWQVSLCHCGCFSHGPNLNTNLYSGNCCHSPVIP